MSGPRVMVLRAAGINCDEDTQHAWSLAQARCDVVHLNQVIDRPGLLQDYDILTLPGGFSFGDDVSAGRIFANRMIHNLADAIHAFLDRDGLVLGICNGFQVLVESGLLRASDAGDRCSLALNTNGHYTCRWVTLECPCEGCVFLQPKRKYFLPMAHAEGRFAVADEAAFDRRRVALRYAEGTPRRGAVNPNGSFDHVAALTDATGRVLGMMPHPERFVRPTQHPFWTAGGADGEPDGLAIFTTAVGLYR